VTQSILETFRQSGDASIGQTLIRLAKLAQARHQFEQTAYVSMSGRKESTPVHGSGRAAVVDGLPSADDQSAHMEVDR
jgi:hypothetical protein